MTAMTGIWLDSDEGVVTAGGGTSLGEVIDAALAAGWFLPVTPGTRHVTVGGAIAADVHGKNHCRNGSFGQYIDSMELVTGAGEALTVAPGSDTFAATVGGMGLTGIITRARFRLVPAETSWMSVDTASVDSLEGVMNHITSTESTYSVAWIDLTRSGQGVVSSAEHASAEEAEGRRSSTASRSVLQAPSWTPRIVNRQTVEIFNRLRFARAPQRETGTIESLSSYFYPLDRLSNWNRLYGRRGFIQYQFVVPEGQEETLLAVANSIARTPTPAALAVLKKMGPSRGGLLSFPTPGWTLAVDLPIGDPGLSGVLDDCDLRVVSAGGRVYLAKDSRMRSGLVPEMYPDLNTWREIRSRLDPLDLLRSDLSERLRLSG